MTPFNVDEIGNKISMEEWKNGRMEARINYGGAWPSGLFKRKNESLRQNLIMFTRMLKGM